jgi:hypothetical protein
MKLDVEWDNGGQVNATKRWFLKLRDRETGIERDKTPLRFGIGEDLLSDEADQYLLEKSKVQYDVERVYEEELNEMMPGKGLPEGGEQEKEKSKGWTGWEWMKRRRYLCTLRDDVSIRKVKMEQKQRHNLENADLPTSYA